MTFETLGLTAPLLRALADAGHATPTDVQSAALPPAIAGRDLMIASSTGSGKTAAYLLPALERVLAARAAGVPQAQPVPTGEARPRGPQAPKSPTTLVLAPTRELALQVTQAAWLYGRQVGDLRVATVVGGVPYPAQLKALRGKLDILIATPGRLLDHLRSGVARLDHVELFVLDEADRMLDLGFFDDIRTIADHLPPKHQTLMLSATFAGNVGRLAQGLLAEPQRIDVAAHTSTHADIEQRLHWADDLQHKEALLDHVLTQKDVDQAIVFTSTQRDADVLADRLADMGHKVASLHGGMPQGRRNRVLQGLRQQHLRVLVATDVAARGIDVPSISHVINFGLPMKAEDYVHRIGRTGRAGRSGLAVTLAERRDGGMIHRIQRFTTQTIPVATIGGLEPKRQVMQPAAVPMPRKLAPGQKPGRRPLGGRPPGAPNRDGFKPRAAR